MSEVADWQWQAWQFDCRFFPSGRAGGMVKPDAATVNDMQK
jgi:hypothetical protein